LPVRLTTSPLDLRVEEPEVALDSHAVVLRAYVRGRGSGIDAELPFAHLIAVRDGKATTLRMYTDESAALEAAGLRE
jgi:ketosteroid isomerase-like protein